MLRRVSEPMVGLVDDVSRTYGVRLEIIAMLASISANLAMHENLSLMRSMWSKCSVERTIHGIEDRGMVHSELSCFQSATFTAVAQIAQVEFK